MGCLGSRFGSDNRVWMWDMHNEPDGTTEWQAPGAHFTAAAIGWMRSTFAKLSSVVTQPITMGCVLSTQFLYDICDALPGSRYVPQMHHYSGFDPLNTSGYHTSVVQSVKNIYTKCGNRAFIFGEWGRPGHSGVDDCAVGGGCSEQSQALLYGTFARGWDCGVITQ